MSRSPLAAPVRESRRLDQWLWFARLVKTRSLAARLCAAGGVAVNGVVAAKPNHAVRIGDTIVLTVGGWRRTSRVVALGNRRGPAAEARTLHEAAAPAARVAPAAWEMLLLEEAE